MVYGKFKPTYDELNDSFRIEILVVPCGALACLVNHDYSPVEVSTRFCDYHLQLVPIHLLLLLNQCHAVTVELFFTRCCGHSLCIWSL